MCRSHLHRAGKQRRDDDKKCNAVSARIHSLTPIDVTLFPSFLEEKTDASLFILLGGYCKARKSEKSLLETTSEG